LLGGIFLSEHGDSWPRTAVDGPWASGGAGQGPFQIENWDNFWKQTTEQGYGSGSGDVNDLYDAGVAAAVSLKVGFEKKDIPLNTTEEKYVKFAGMYHNRGDAAAYDWADAGYDLSKPPENTTNPGWEWGANDYALRTWTSFQNLNVGCLDATSLAANSSAIIKVAAEEIGTTASPSDCVKYNPRGKCQPWCAAFVSWVYNQAGYDFSPVYSAQALLNYMNSNQTALLPDKDNIKAGDMVFFKSPTPGVTHHVGIAVTVVGSKIRVIEGNSSGDKVVQNNYKISDFLAVARWTSSSP